MGGHLAQEFKVAPALAALQIPPVDRGGERWLGDDDSSYSSTAPLPVICTSDAAVIVLGR